MCFPSDFIGKSVGGVELGKDDARFEPLGGWKGVVFPRLMQDACIGRGEINFTAIFFPRFLHRHAVFICVSVYYMCVRICRGESKSASSAIYQRWSGKILPVRIRRGSRWDSYIIQTRGSTVSYVLFIRRWRTLFGGWLLLFRILHETFAVVLKFRTELKLLMAVVFPRKILIFLCKSLRYWVIMFRGRHRLQFTV